MTLILCYDPDWVDNMASCLRVKPDKVILLGNVREMAKPAERYEQILKDRNIPAKVTLCDVQDDVVEISDTIARLIRVEDDCIIDLTDCHENVAVAVGMMLGKIDREAYSDLKICSYDEHEGIVTDYFTGEQRYYEQSETLTVREVLYLNGGKLYPATIQPSPFCRPGDIARLWDRMIANPKSWNITVTTLAEFEEFAEVAGDGLEIHISLNGLRNRIEYFYNKERQLREFLAELDRMGVLQDRSDWDSLDYIYTNSMFRYCMQKAGNILEVKALLEARTVLTEGKPYFGDCQTGVGIDWDGKIHKPWENVPETRNEVDVILMRGVTPLFVSCKNGNIEEDEPYKLHTVADRFGGPYVKKMLIATQMDPRKPDANEAFMTRMEDMGIYFVPNAAELTHEQWREAFLKAMIYTGRSNG